MPEAEKTERPREQAAAAVNVSPRMVEAASQVIKQGTPELVKAVDDGRVKVAMLISRV